MISKETANKESETIIDNERQANSSRRLRSLRFRYGLLLENELIQKYGDQPEIIDKAIKFSHAK